MFAFVSLASFVLPLLSVAQLVPVGPGPNDVFKPGGPCPISWSADSSGKWKSTNIELMTGDNQQMTHLTTVANVDGTDPSKTSFSFTCPAVAPNAAIYFYQFTAAGQNATWTTRFAISDPNGVTTSPPNAAQPDGSPIPWGDGKLLSTQGTPPPATAPPGQLDGSNPDSSSSVSLGSFSVFNVTASSVSSSGASTPLSASASTTAPSASDSPVSNPAPGSTAALATPSMVTVPLSSSTPAAASATTGSSSSPNSAIANTLPAAPALVAAALLALVTLC